MLGRKYKLFSLMGFEVGVDASWIILAILVAWSLSTGLFPVQYKNYSTTVYWLMGVLGAVGLFLSIIAHELAHSIVARRNGIPMKGITLFLFGGVAHMNTEPPGPGPEFRMALVGPVSSILIALVFYGIHLSGKALGGYEPVYGVSGYLAMINTLLAIFNLIPAFPLDGGRILRAILWKTKGNLKWATRISSKAGQVLGYFLIFFGLFRILSGNLVGGIWFFLIGIFLNNIARISYQQVLARSIFNDKPVACFMKTDIVTVPLQTTLDRIIQDYAYRYHYKRLPVVDDNQRLLGCLHLDQLKSIPRDSWPDTTVGHIVRPCPEESTVFRFTPAVDALSQMKDTGLSRLMVIDEYTRLVGVLSLRDMLEHLSIKVSLENDEST